MGLALAAYMLVMYVVGSFARERVHNEEDFLVAGRNLPLSLSWASLLATWFGAGTMLTASETVRQEGLPGAALDPLGAGACLLLAGFFFAKPLWQLKILTLADYFKVKFGPKAELAASLIMVPSFFGWVAAQFLALAHMLQLFFGLDLAIGLAVVAVLATGYTVLGGMWSVTLTEALQIALVFLGLGVLGFMVLIKLGDGSLLAGWARLGELPPDKLRLVPHQTQREFTQWLGVLAIGALGNIPGQDLLQRIFSARSAQVAQRACWIAGGLYFVLGAVPVMLGLASQILFPGKIQGSMMMMMAHTFLGPVLAVVFTVSLTSAVLSTVTSAMLAPAAVISHNLLRRTSARRFDALSLNRWAVVMVAIASLIFAYLGESAYSLLEDAYAMPLVGLLVPLTVAIYRPAASEAPALVAMAVGTSVWLLHYLLGWETFGGMSALHLPVALTSATLSLIAYFMAEPLGKKRAP